MFEVRDKRSRLEANQQFDGWAVIAVCERFIPDRISSVLLAGIFVHALLSRKRIFRCCSVLLPLGAVGRCFSCTLLLFMVCGVSSSLL